MREPTDEDYKWATEDRDKNRELHELLGLCWHEVTDTYPLDLSGSQHCNTCEEYITDKNPHENPDYASDAGKIQLLREMKKRPDYSDFCNTIGQVYTFPGEHERLISDVFTLDTSGKLRDTAIEWLSSPMPRS